MTDPREAALPKWAQTLLEEQRVKLALSWPTEARPTPVMVCDSNGLVKVGEDIREGVLWKLSFGGIANQVTIDGGRMFYVDNTMPYRREGEFFLSKKDALLAQLWAKTENAAQMLHRLQLDVANA